MPHNTKSAYQATVRAKLASGLTNNAEGVWVGDHKNREGAHLVARLASNTARNKRRKSGKSLGTGILAWGHVRPHPEWRAN